MADTIENAGSEEESYGNYDMAFANENQPANDNQADYAPGFNYGGEPDTYGPKTSNSGIGGITGEQLADYYTSGTPGVDPNADFSWASGLQSAAAGTSLTSGVRTGQSGISSIRSSQSQSTRNLGSTTTSKTIFPAGQAWPTFQGPKWDEKAIRAKARKITAPLISEMGQKVQQVISKYYENPNVRRTVLRDTLAGYGIGLGRALAQGEASARAEYSQEYGRQYNEAMNNYNMLKDKLMAQSEKVTTTTPVTSSEQLKDLVSTSTKSRQKKVQYTLSGRAYTIS